MQHKDALAQLALAQRRARRALALERGFALAAPPLALAAAWLVLCLAAPLTSAPPWAQSLLVLAMDGAVLFAAARAFLRWRRPTEREVRARLALQTGLDPETWEALEDRPVAGASAALGLWRGAEAQAAAAALRLSSLRWPANLNRSDPLRLRYFALAALAIASVIAGPAAPDRALRAFIPDPGPLLGDRPLALEAWLAPAAYTGAEIVPLPTGARQAIPAPPRATAIVRLTGPVAPPLLVYEADGRRHSVRFRPTPGGAHEARLNLTRPGQLRVVRFFTHASWRIEPTPDRPPVIAFAAAPARGDGEEMRLAWQAQDDFGVSAMALRIQPLSQRPGLSANHAVVETPLPPPQGAPRSSEGETQIDLAPHPFAGLEVEARLIARDALGQRGESPPIRFTMPERAFSQPLAQAIIEARQALLWEHRAYPRPTALPRLAALFAARPAVASVEEPPLRPPAGIARARDLLAALTMAPDDRFFADRAVFLMLALARSRLARAQDLDTAHSAGEPLWRAALRAEAGVFTDARRALAEAEEALRQALESGAGPERLRSLTDALRRATDAYLQARMAQAAQENPAPQAGRSPPTTLTGQDIQDLLNNVEEAAQSGRTDAAQEDLRSLTDILNNLEISLGAGTERGQQGGRDESASAARSQQTGRSPTQAQAALNAETAAARRAGTNAATLADRQGALRRSLEGTDAGSRQARSAMLSAEAALRAGDWETAQAAQEEALNALAAPATPEAAPAPDQSGAVDPLGRTSAAGAGESSGVVIPRERAAARSRAVLEAIRSRAADPARTPEERAYLLRLLERFQR